MKIPSCDIQVYVFSFRCVYAISADDVLGRRLRRGIINFVPEPFSTQAIRLFDHKEEERQAVESSSLIYPLD
jgi:hypothetical protein